MTKHLTKYQLRMNMIFAYCCLSVNIISFSPLQIYHIKQASTVLNIFAMLPIYFNRPCFAHSHNNSCCQSYSSVCAKSKKTEKRNGEIRMQCHNEIASTEIRTFQVYLQVHKSGLFRYICNLSSNK